MIYPLVTDLADEGIPVVLTCRFRGSSKEAYFRWRANPVSQRDWDDAHLINTAIDIHHDDPGFGYRFITDELAGKGVKASRNRVNRLCTAQQIWSVDSRKRGLNRRPRSAGARRPGAAPVHRAAAERAVAYRHHRAPDSRGQALPLRGQRRLLQPHRRLLHGQPA